MRRRVIFLINARPCVVDIKWGSLMKNKEYKNKDKSRTQWGSGWFDRLGWKFVEWTRCGGRRRGSGGVRGMLVAGARRSTALGTVGYACGVCGQSNGGVRPEETFRLAPAFTNVVIIGILYTSVPRFGTVCSEQRTETPCFLRAFCK